jgi:ribosomal protein L40E
MTPEKVAALKASAPTVWPGDRFEHDDGWFQILHDLGLKLAPLGVVIGGVKEKYAQLDFFVSSPEAPYGPDSIKGLLDEAIAKSMETCEVCGERGRHCETENMWEAVRCRKCQGDRYRPTSPDPDFVEASEPHKPMPDPTPEMLKDPVWNAIYDTIKSWDVNVPEFYNGYCGANGSHATLIYQAVQKATFDSIAKLSHEEDTTEVTSPSTPSAKHRL